MSESRSINTPANALGDCFRNFGNVPFATTDGMMYVSGMARKSGLMLRRAIHHRESTFNGNKNQSGDGIWDRTCIYLRIINREISCAIQLGERDKASGAFCIVGKSGGMVKIWDASKNAFWPGEYAWEDVPTLMSDPDGMKTK